MTGSNRFASLSHSRVREERLGNDEYETPAEVTALLRKIVPFDGPILDPCCGSGRILKCFSDLECVGADLREIPGVPRWDYLEHEERWDGDVVTNPPYHDGMAENFVVHALYHSMGKVAMLLQSGFLFGRERTNSLRTCPPAVIISVPWRIRFHIGGTDQLIRSQAYNHVWAVWPTMDKRLPTLRTEFVLGFAP